MLIALVPTTLDDLSGVGFVLLDRCIGQQPNVVVYIEIEERAGLAPGFVDYEVVEGVMLVVRRRE